MTSPQASSADSVRELIQVGRDIADPHVVTLTLDRPPLNLFTPGDYARLAECLGTAAKDATVRCIVITGAGERCLSAGSDVSGYGTRGPEGSLEVARIIWEAFHALKTGTIPTICAVNGAAIGAGLMLAAACDVVVASESATFRLPEIEFGIMGGPGFAFGFLPEKVVRYMALTALSLDAQEMHRMGAVNFVVPAADVVPKALTIARVIAGKSPAGARLMKEAMSLGSGRSELERFRIEQLYTAVARQLPDTAEALAARAEKRSPEFKP